jgi:hypothetical protein
MQSPAPRIRVGLHNVAPMIRSVIEGAIGEADDITLATEDDQTVHVVLVPTGRTVIAFSPGALAIHLCAMQPCSDAYTAEDLVNAIRHVGREPAAG